jgi:two-component system response regulator ChvI
MLVDDEMDILSITGRSLQLGGSEVCAYSNSTRVLIDFKPNYFDIMIIDIRLPLIDGFELYRRIRKVDVKVKVCFFTAFEASEAVFNNTIANIDPYAKFVKKPLRGGALLKIIEEMLSHVPITKMKVSTHE